MNMIELVIIAVIALAVFFALRHIVRMRKCGCSCGCSGCSMACEKAAAQCKKEQAE